MKKGLVFSILISIALLGATFLFARDSEPVLSHDVIAVEKEILVDKVVPDEIKIYMQSMSLKEKIAQMLLFGYWGGSSTKELVAAIENGIIGSVILMNSNTGTAEEIKTVINLLQKSVPENTPKLFISVDQEGGAVSRISNRYVDTKAQYEIKSENEAYETAMKRGEKLAELGININFSPVLENIQNPNSFLYKRVFRGDNQEISKLGSAMVRGYQDTKVISVIKHFPGHKNSSLDSHKGLPIVYSSYDELIESIIPFINVIKEEEVEMIMMSHILYVELDNEYPASISPYFINLLRDELRFNGIIITDDMNMGGITKKFNLKEAAIQAVVAGNDILLYVVEPRLLREVYDTLINSVQNGLILESQIDESVERILRLKQKYNLFISN